MYQLLVKYLDCDDIPRVFCYGECNNLNDILEILQFATDELKDYAKSKPYFVDITEFSFEFSLAY